MKKDFESIDEIDESLINGSIESESNDLSDVEKQVDNILSDAAGKTDEEFVESIPDELFNISDDAINASLEQLDKSSKKKGKKKKSAGEITDEIVAAYLDNRTDANWSALQERFWYGIKKYSYMFIKNWDTADDITIETFTKAYTSIDKFDRTKAKFSTWLWTICRNNCLLYLKRESRLSTIDKDISEVYDSTLSNSCKTNVDETPQYVLDDDGRFTALSNSDIIQKLYDTSICEMKNLGGTAATILEMKLVKNMKIREIGAELGMNESTVKNYLYKGKEDLSTIMKAKHKDLYEMYLESNAERDEMEM